MSQVMVVMLAALAAEILLLAFAALLVSWLRNRAARRRDLQAMRGLLARVKKGKAEREAVIGSFLGERMGLAGENLEQARVVMLRAEMYLIQQFAHLYGRRDAAMAGRFDAEVVAAIDPYHGLVGSTVVAESAPPADDGTELDELRRENERLSAELRITMETMSRMLNEYSTMFSGSAPAAAVPIVSLAAARGMADVPAGAGDVSVDPGDIAATGAQADVVEAVGLPDADAATDEAAAGAPERPGAGDDKLPDQPPATDVADIGVQVEELEPVPDDPGVAQDDAGLDVAETGDSELPGSGAVEAAAAPGAAAAQTAADPRTGPRPSPDSIDDVLAEIEKSDTLVAAQAAEAGIVDGDVGKAGDREFLPGEPAPIGGEPDKVPAGEAAPRAPSNDDGEKGGDLEQVSDMLEAGDVEVIGFTETGDDELADLEGEDADLFDAIDEDTIVRATAADVTDKEAGGLG